MILTGDHTKASQNPGLLSNRVVTAVPWPSASKIIFGSSGYMMIDASSNVTMRSHGVISGAAVAINYDQLLSFTWYTPGDGIIIGSEGAFNPHLSSNTSNITLTSFGTFLESTLLSDNTSNITIDSYGTIWNDVEKLNWIAWSDVGSLDFTQTRKNVAGAMPMDWQGSVYGIKKHGNVFIVMGVNGVSIITPTGALMGLNTIHKIGLIGRDAFAGNDSILYFVDKLGALYQFTDTLKKLDYKEFLAGLSNLTLTFDESTNFLYLCNGTKGYVYSQESDSFGAGPINITGSGYKTGVLYLTSPAAIATPVFEIKTDIYDFGTRNLKTVYSLDFGTDSSGVFQAAIEYRGKYNTSFSTTAWKNIHPKGSVQIVCRGSEFRFKFKVTTYKSFELDYFDVDYKIHAH